MIVILVRVGTVMAVPHKCFCLKQRQSTCAYWIHDDISYFRTNRLPLLRSGVYTPESIVTEEVQLESELATLQEVESASVLAMAELKKEITILSELIKTPYQFTILQNHTKKSVSLELSFQNSI